MAMATSPLRTQVGQLLREASVLFQSCSRIHTQSSPLLFQATQQLWAEPMKRKKRIDPSVIAAREQKKIKRIDKEIRRLTKFGRMLKPVAEIEMTNAKIKIAEERRRPSPVLSFDESEERALLLKQWARYRTAQWHEVNRLADKQIDAQEEALEELRKESEVLYKAAIQPDVRLIPLFFSGPKQTPPIKDYNPPDGEYVDTTRKY